MQRIWGLVIVLGGCSHYFGGPDDDDVHPDARRDRADAAVPSPDAVPGLGTCVADVSLALAGTMFVDVPITLDVYATTLCIRLDSTARTHPTYFDAKTPMEPSTLASFELTLFDTAEQLLAEGYDAQLPLMATYAIVNYYIQTSDVRYVKLEARARETSQATQLSLGLYQILD